MALIFIGVFTALIFNFCQGTVIGQRNASNESYESYESGSREDPEFEYDFMIVGGTAARKHEFPFIVNIQVGRDHYCGGSIVNKDWVLTAAHCMQRRESDYTFIAGDHDNQANDNTEQRRRVQARRIVNHRDYNKDTNNYDFSMVKMSQSFELKKGVIEAVSLPPVDFRQMRNSRNAVVAGWGALRENGNSPRILQKVTVPLVTNEGCNDRYRKNRIRITDIMLCAGREGKDSCQGDSGGPLMCKANDGGDCQCGVVSFGIGCGDKDYPGVYARTSQVNKWIIDTSRT